MERSEQINELLTAISLAYGDLKNAKLNAKNPHFKSEYATLEEILNTIRPVVSKHGLMFSQVPETIGNEIYLTTFIGHKSGQWMKSSLKLILQKNDSQGMGSAITYARRYSISSWFGIGEGEDDDGNEATKEETKAPIEEASITPEQLKQVMEKVDLLPKELVDSILKGKGWKTFSEMKKKQFSVAMAFLDEEVMKLLNKGE